MGFINLKELPELKISDGITGHAVNTITQTVFHARLVAGAILPPHAHYQEQIVNVVEGELELVVEGHSYRLVPGTAMVLPPNVAHSGRVIKDTYIVDVFHPAREDFRGASFGGYPGKK